MKRSVKFLIVFLVVITLLSGVNAILSVNQLDRLKDSSNNSLVEIIASVKEAYPDVSETQIAEILNKKTNTGTLKESLENYGIQIEDEWMNLEIEQICGKIVLANVIFTFTSGIVLCGVFIVYCIQRKKEVKTITAYIEKINKKQYDLDIPENSEDEMSLLKNEIYKTTVMLREQADNSLSDKENLKDSLSDISHQLKTPLTSILVMLDNIIENEDMSDELKLEFLNDIRRSANSMTFLVQSILTLSKLDADTIVFKYNNEKLDSILKACVANTAVLAELRDVNVTFYCDDSLEMSCDFKWLCEAVTNIVKNCIEHTDKDGVVKISAERNKLYTKIVVSDNGCGIDKEDLSHIFERFYKGKNSSDDSVGIGLALAKSITEKMGGYISVESVEGEGTTFVLKFFKS